VGVDGVEIDGCECMSTIFISDLRTLLFFKDYIAMSYSYIFLEVFLRANACEQVSAEELSYTHEYMYGCSSGPLDQSIGKLFYFIEKWFNPEKITHIEEIYNDRMKEAEFPPEVFLTSAYEWGYELRIFRDVVFVSGCRSEMVRRFARFDGIISV
jgi:hypothetical protein